MKSLYTSFLIILFTSCVSNSEIPTTLKGYDYFVATEYSYEYGKNDQVLARENRTYYILDGSKELVEHTKNSYSYNQQDSLVKVKSFDLMVGDATTQVKEIVYDSKNERLMEFTINSQGDTISSTFHSEINGNKKTIEMISFGERGSKNFNSHYNISIYGSDKKLQEIWTGESLDRLSKNGLLTYDSLGRLQSQRWYDKSKAEEVESETTFYYIANSDKIETTVTLDAQGDTTFLRRYYYDFQNTSPTEIRDYLDQNLVSITSYDQNNKLVSDLFFFTEGDSSKTIYIYEEEVLVGKVQGNTN